MGFACQGMAPRRGPLFLLCSDSPPNLKSSAPDADGLVGAVGKESSRAQPSGATPSEAARCHMEVAMAGNARKHPRIQGKHDRAGSRRRLHRFAGVHRDIATHRPDAWSCCALGVLKFAPISLLVTGVSWGMARSLRPGLGVFEPSLVAIRGQTRQQGMDRDAQEHPG